ncbi:MAG TPA: hypothetical protein VFJ50_11665, partial [Gemmatimonadales bacterium]|nr:hypothetical protein [Gemmatimonadales bacterium]
MLVVQNGLPLWALNLASALPRETYGDVRPLARAKKPQFAGNLALDGADQPDERDAPSSSAPTSSRNSEAELEHAAAAHVQLATLSL